VPRVRASDAFQAALQADDPVELYERAPCGYLTTDPDGRILKANRTFLVLTGYEQEHLLQRRFADLMTPGGRIFEQTHLMPMLRMQGEAREIALDLVRSDGEVLPVLLNATLDARAEQAAVIRVAVFDATERRGYERELLAAKERAETSERRARSLARTLQQTLIPPGVPEIPNLDIAAGYRPSGDGAEVGGDFYDVFETGTGTWVALLGDVCGKGPEAAVVTALVRHTVRAVSVAHDRPAQVLRRVNEVLVRDAVERYCTIVLSTLRPVGSEWEIVVSVGGHPSPVLVGGDGGSRSLGLRGPLVGVFADAAYTDHELRLVPGQTLLAYTDGVTEARGPEGYYGEARLLRTLAGLGPDPRAFVDGLVEDAVAFQGPVTRDDIAVLALGVPRG
jgi:sigma-B regulation protein RsbU (phosphoserine phosphatase)